jgi:hypothetical protein
LKFIVEFEVAHAPAYEKMTCGQKFHSDRAIMNVIKSRAKNIVIETGDGRKTISPMLCISVEQGPVTVED